MTTKPTARTYMNDDDELVIDMTPDDEATEDEILTDDADGQGQAS